MDMSFMSKFKVQGRDAGRVLNHVSANSVDGSAGTITYTQWLDELGKLQAELTVTKLADDDCFVVATDTSTRNVESNLGLSPINILRCRRKEGGKNRRETQQKKINRENKTSSQRT